MGKLLTNLPQLTLAQLWPTLRSTTVGTCRRDLKLSHRPDGKIADVLATTHACTTAANTPANYRMYVPKRPSMFPIAPMGFSLFLRLCLQGGGVYINSGTVTLSSCTITGNTASSVRGHAQNFPSPPWKTHFLLVVCREAVSTSFPARSR